MIATSLRNTSAPRTHLLRRRRPPQQHWHSLLMTSAAHTLFTASHSHTALTIPISPHHFTSPHLAPPRHVRHSRAGTAASERRRRRRALRLSPPPPGINRGQPPGRDPTWGRSRSALTGPTLTACGGNV